jgi:hypothetical protein
MIETPNLSIVNCVWCFLISTNFPPLSLFLLITDLEVNFLSSPCSSLGDTVSNHRKLNRNVDLNGRGKSLKMERFVCSDSKSASVTRHKDGEQSCSQTRPCAMRDKMYITVSP